jgi:hypothetical protein
MELFVRKANLRLSNRNFPELQTRSLPGSRADINRISFQLLANGISIGAGPAKCTEYLRSMEGVAKAAASINSASIREDDYREISDLSLRMHRQLFILQKSPVFLDPSYPGCGIINTCHGDAITEDLKLIELKDGDRPFRAYEFRQLVIYAALHMNSTGTVPSALEVINSRRGTSVTLSMEAFAKEVAGQPAYDLLEEVIRIISELTLSA